jgi:zinc-ribbon domain
MGDCPNCGKPVEPGAALCPHCGFDVNSQQADAVRQLREQGLIHPGRLGAKERDDSPSRDLHERRPDSELPAEDRGTTTPREIDAGL